MDGQNSSIPRDDAQVTVSHKEDTTKPSAPQMVRRSVEHASSAHAHSTSLPRPPSKSRLHTGLAQLVGLVNASVFQTSDQIVWRSRNFENDEIRRSSPQLEIAYFRRDKEDLKALRKISIKYNASAISLSPQRCFRIVFPDTLQGQEAADRCYRHIHRRRMNGIVLQVTYLESGSTTRDAWRESKAASKSTSVPASESLSDVRGRSNVPRPDTTITGSTSSMTSFNGILQPRTTLHDEAKATGIAKNQATLPVTPTTRTTKHFPGLGVSELPISLPDPGLPRRRLSSSSEAMSIATTASERPSSSSSKSAARCCVCKITGGTEHNPLMMCQCRRSYHAACHKPAIPIAAHRYASTKSKNWICSICSKSTPRASSDKDSGFKLRKNFRPVDEIRGNAHTLEDTSPGNISERDPRDIPGWNLDVSSTKRVVAPCGEAPILETESGNITNTHLVADQAQSGRIQSPEAASNMSPQLAVLNVLKAVNSMPAISPALPNNDSEEALDDANTPPHDPGKLADVDITTQDDLAMARPHSSSSSSRQASEKSLNSESNLMQIPNTEAMLHTEVFDEAKADSEHHLSRADSLSMQDEMKRPKETWHELITAAVMTSANRRMETRDIAEWIRSNYPFYKDIFQHDSLMSSLGATISAGIVKGKYTKHPPADPKTRSACSYGVVSQRNLKFQRKPTPYPNSPPPPGSMDTNSLPRKTFADQKMIDKSSTHDDQSAGAGTDRAVPVQSATDVGYRMSRAATTARIVPKHDNLPWDDLNVLPDASNSHQTFTVGDIVRILTQNGDEDEFAVILEMRQVREHCIGVVVLWYISHKEALRTSNSKAQSDWPIGYKYMLSNQVDIIGFQAIVGKATAADCLTIFNGDQMWDYATRANRIRERTSKKVGWAWRLYQRATGVETAEDQHSSSALDQSSPTPLLTSDSLSDRQCSIEVHTPQDCAVVLGKRKRKSNEDVTDELMTSPLVARSTRLHGMDSFSSDASDGHFHSDEQKHENGGIVSEDLETPKNGIQDLLIFPNVDADGGPLLPSDTIRRRSPSTVQRELEASSMELVKLQARIRMLELERGCTMQASLHTPAPSRANSNPPRSQDEDMITGSKHDIIPTFRETATSADLSGRGPQVGDETMVDVRIVDEQDSHQRSLDSGLSLQRNLHHDIISNDPGGTMARHAAFAPPTSGAAHGMHLKREKKKWFGKPLPETGPKKYGETPCDSLRAFLGVPEGFVICSHDGRLAFRDDARKPDGTLLHPESIVIPSRADEGDGFPPAR